MRTLSGCKVAPDTTQGDDREHLEGQNVPDGEVLEDPLFLSASSHAKTANDHQLSTFIRKAFEL